MTIPIPDSTTPALPPLPPLPDTLSNIVFTHTSALTPQLPISNTRLTLLGNSLLHSILTRLLYHHPSSLSKQEINDVRTHYVKETMRWGMKYDLAGSRFVVAMGQRQGMEGDEELTGRRAGEVFEAYIGALDTLSHGGQDSDSEGSETAGGEGRGDLATKFITALISPTLDAAIRQFRGTKRCPSQPSSPSTTSSSSSSLSLLAEPGYNKSALQKLNERLCQQGLSPEEQRERWTKREDVSSPDHRFSFGFQIDKDLTVYGEGKTVKEAKARTAERVLTRMNGPGVLGSGLGSASGSTGGRRKGEKFEFEFDVESEFKSSSIGSNSGSRWRKGASSRNESDGSR